MRAAPPAAPPDGLAAVPPAEPWRWRLAIFCGYLVAVVAMTWPLALRWQTALIQKQAGPTDAGQGVWNLWWAAQSLSRVQNPYLSSYIFYPQKIDLFWQTLSLPNALLALPATLALGPIAAFNLLALLSFGLGGYFAYRLAHGVLGDRPAALAAGFIFAFCGYHMQMLLGGPLELIAVQWIPLYVIALMRALARPSIWRALAAAGALALTTLASQYYGLFCAVYSALHVLISLAAAPPAERQRRLVTAIGVAGVWLAALLPFVWPLQSLGSTGLEDWRDRQVFHSVELVDFLAPNVLHPLWGQRAVAWLTGQHSFGIETGATLGLAVCALAAYGCWRVRAARPWLALALLTAAFTLGPELKFGDQPTGIPLPFALLDLLGPFRNSSRPTSFLPILMLPVGVLAGFGLRALRARRGWAGAGLAAALVVVEYLAAPWPIQTARVAPLYTRMRADPVAGAVVELPPSNDGSQYMLNQLCHGRPLAGGYLARTPDYPVVAYDSTLRRLWLAAPAEPDIFPADPAGELATLGVRYVTLNLGALRGSAADDLHRELQAPGITRTAADEHAEVYQIDAGAARPVLLPGAGWQAPERDARLIWRWMGDRADLRLLTRAPAQIALAFSATAYQAPHQLALALDGVPLASYAVPAAPGSQPIDLRLMVPAGDHTIELTSAALPTPEGRRVSISISQLSFSARPLPGPALAPPPTLPPIAHPPCIGG